MVEVDTNQRVRVQAFVAATAGELAAQVNAFLADIPAACVRAVRFHTVAVAATMDDESRWEYAALVEYEAGA